MTASAIAIETQSEALRAPEPDLPAEYERRVIAFFDKALLSRESEK